MAILTEAEGSTFRTLFNQDNQTYRWESSLLYNYKPSDRFRVLIDGRLRSTLIKESLIASGADQWQEDREINSRLTYQFSPRVGVNFDIYQSYNSLGQRRLQDSEITGGAVYRLTRWLKFNYRLGGMITSRDEELGKRLDRGAKMFWNAMVDSRVFGRDRLNAEFSIEENIFRTIPSNEFTFTGEYSKSFAGGDSFLVKYVDFRGKRKYYASAYSLEGTNSQVKHERALESILIKGIPLGVQTRIEAAIDFNEYRYTSEEADSSELSRLKDRDNSRFSHNLVVSAGRKFHIADRTPEITVHYRFSGYDEDFGLDERDQESSYGELGCILTFDITDRDSLSADASVGVRSFYHPDEFALIADRDVSSEIFNLTYSRIWSKYLRSNVRFGYRSFDQIYLSRLSSADNNSNYTYLLAPGIVWSVSEKLSVYQNFEIQANYITYDYEKRLLNSRNRIFRRGDSRSRMEYRFSENLIMDIEYGYRYEDYGQLVWDEQWQQLTSWDRRTHFGNITFDYLFFGRFRVLPGYSFDYKREWEHTEETDPTDDEAPIEKARVMKDRQDQRIISLQFEYIFSELERFTFAASRRIIDGWRRGHIRDDKFTVSLSRSF
ncbi:MAG: hypothetical protein GF307_07020 [candidate division Zixibacteria bacterium]|nr:hypothetical protein [candidate division Zixibacteria bacterium]